MTFDFTCACGKGIRILRGDLPEVTCGACGQQVPVPAQVRSSRPSEFRSFAVQAAPVEPTKGSSGERIFFGICWAVGLGMLAVPFFMKSEYTELYRKTISNPTPQNLAAFLELSPSYELRADVIRAGFDRALGSNDVEMVRTVVANWATEAEVPDRAERLWTFAERNGTESAYELYLQYGDDIAHRHDAEAALDRIRGISGPEATPPSDADRPIEETYTPPEETYTPPEETPAAPEETHTPPTPSQEELERQDLASLEASPGKEAAFAFLDKYPDSASRGTVAGILLRQLEAEWSYPPDSPSPTTLLQITQSKGTNEITISASGFTSDDTRQQVLNHVRWRLEGLGLRVTEVAEQGDIRVAGSESTDSTQSYSKTAHEMGPFAESISATIEVYVPGSYEPAFTSSPSAYSPETVDYSYFGDFDPGPTQYDVHSNTLSELSKQMESVFRYR